MTRTRSTLTRSFVALGFVAALAVPSVASAADGPDDTNIIVVAPAPAPQPTSAPAVAPAPVPPPPTYMPPPPPRPPMVDPRVASLKAQRNSGLGMTISGYTMFGTSYLISALVGTISLDLAADVGGSGTYGRRMMIPIVGPFMAINRSDSATGGLFTAILGVVQTTGFVLGTAGAVKYGRARRQLRLTADAGGIGVRF